MVTETMENGVYKIADDDNVLLIIEALGNDIYKAKNSDMEIMAEVVMLDDQTTKVSCLSYRRADGNEKYKKSNKLMAHYTKWFGKILKDKGFI